MIQENKELLLKDLSTRLPYGVKCDINDNKPYTLSSISNDYDGTLIRFKEQKNGFNMEVYLSEVKPYLFPLSSMTEEQEIEYDATFATIIYEDGRKDSAMTYKSFDWLNKNNFDYRGLIDKGLALDATGLNIY
jgi:hypothetical protein